ncbi:MAG: integrase arm-type DNA-binding domain-containing protein [Henriciella sp.]
MATNLLSDRKIMSGANGTKLQDGRGLELDVSKTGKRSWFLRYSFGPKRARKKIGVYPALSKEEARETRDQYMKWIAAGIDPETRTATVVNINAAKSSVLTFGEFVDSEVPKMTTKLTSPKHRAQWLSTLHTYCKPNPIWSMPLADVDQDAVAECIAPLWRTKNETMSRLRGRIKKVMDRAKAQRKFKGDNPASWELMQHFVEELTPQEKAPRHHPAIEYKNAPAFWQKLSERDGPAADCLRIVMLTCLRTSEAKGADWSEFDFENMIWTVPGPRMKLKKDHAVPITEAMFEVLDSIPGSRTGFVFKNPVKGNILSENAMLALIRRMRGDAINEAGDRITTHGMRSTFTDWLGDCTEYDELLAEAQLDHAKGKVTRAYRRESAVERRREMMEAYGQYITGKCEMSALPSNVHRLAG